MARRRSRGLDLALAEAALACALAVSRKAHVPGDGPEDHEDNTFGLPNGNPLRKKLRRYFREQLKRTVGFVAAIGAEIPDRFPRMADYDDAMASAMTPILSQYWDRSGKALRGRLGLDPDEWRVTDPNIHRAVADQSIKFCAKTNATTDLGIAEARDKVREALARGLIGEGETIPQLAGRIRQVFTRAARSRAELIARTETSRAVHAASEMSARQAGVVSAKKWLLSANSCPLCHRLAAAADSVPLGGSFGTVGHDADYSSIRMPPAHPNCRCSVTYILIEEAVGPVPAFVPPASSGHPAAPPESPEEDGSSKAKVEFRGDRKAADRAIRSIFGRQVADADLAGLAGAPDGAKVVIEVTRGLVRADVSGPDYAAERAFRRDKASGRPVIDNELLYIEGGARGRGLGAEIFGRQVAAGRKVGAALINAEAARGEGLNGYYTWPRFGFDAPIPPALASTLPPPLAGAARLSDLMATPAGRDWWKDHGTTVEAEFDLADGSLSRRVWDGYTAAKKAEAKAIPGGAAGREEADFTALDLAIAARVWDAIGKAGSIRG